jgi:hypothetical protein
MSDHIIVADPSNTVRTLVKLALRDQKEVLVEAADSAALIEALSTAGPRMLIVDGDWAVNVEVLELIGEAEAVVVLGPETSRGVPWPDALRLDPDRVSVTSKPVSRGSVRAAADRLIGVEAAPAHGALKAMVTDEVARAVGEEIKSVVWRIVPELAERLIKEELDRLLSEEDDK